MLVLWIFFCIFYDNMSLSEFFLNLVKIFCIFFFGCCLIDYNRNRDELFFGIVVYDFLFEI